MVDQCDINEDYEPNNYSSKELETLVNVSKPTICRYIKAQKHEGFKYGRKVVYEEHVLVELIDKYGRRVIPKETLVPNSKITLVPVTRQEFNELLGRQAAFEAKVSPVIKQLMVAVIDLREHRI